VFQERSRGGGENLRGNGDEIVKRNAAAVKEGIEMVAMKTYELVVIGEVTGNKAAAERNAERKFWLEIRRSGDQRGRRRQKPPETVTRTYTICAERLVPVARPCRITAGAGGSGRVPEPSTGGSTDADQPAKPAC
jgi:curli biogenesis system outer membrane secretion channel CsgG